MFGVKRFFLQVFICLLVCCQSLLAFASMNNRNDVAVIGCGVLGTSLCKKLLESPAFSARTSTYRVLTSSLSHVIHILLHETSCTVTGVTKTSNRHESILEQIGGNDRFYVKTADDIQGQKFRDVVFCAPPSGFDDYAAAVEDAVTNVCDSTSDGAFVFTSSGGM
jgi:hypothetical protein